MLNFTDVNFAGTDGVTPLMKAGKKHRNIVYTFLYTGIQSLEVIQDSWIQLHIKPVKVPTISNDLTQKFF